MRMSKRKAAVDPAVRGGVVNQWTNPLKLQRAREFRKNHTAAEALAWSLLRNRGILGLKFRRQKVIDGFVVDFYCAEHRLILEIDGSIHQDPERMEYDRERTRHFVQRGLRVVRVANKDVSRDSLTRSILQELANSPSPARERG